METIPVFKNRAEQLVWYIRERVIPFLNKISDILDFQRIDLEKFDKIPWVVLMGYIQEIKDNFGTDLDQKNVDVVFRICCVYSGSLTMNDMTEKARGVVELLKKDETIQNQLWKMWGVVKKILN